MAPNARQFKIQTCTLSLCDPINCQIEFLLSTAFNKRKELKKAKNIIPLWRSNIDSVIHDTEKITINIPYNIVFIIF